jgi:hypothetical protein
LTEREISSPESVEECGKGGIGREFVAENYNEELEGERKRESGADRARKLLCLFGTSHSRDFSSTSYEHVREGRRGG